MIRVGYVPYLQDLSHPADRRRLAGWAEDKEINLNVSNPLESDVLVLSNAANFGYWINRSTQPIYLDLVDGYLGENPSFLKDFFRNLLRTFQGLSSLRWITYTRHLRYAIANSYGVIVPSQEQKDLITNLNSNVFVIPDDHFEFEKIQTNAVKIQNSNEEIKYLFWEGYGYTLKHFKIVASQLDHFLYNSNFGLYLVTVSKFKRWGGRIGNVNTRRFIDEIFPLSKDKIKIISWSLENLVHFSKSAYLGIIPINSKDSFAYHKSENKLLSMWKLGLPVLFSKIPSYERVASITGQEVACLESNEWLKALHFFSSSQEDLERIKQAGADYVSTQSNHKSIIKKWDSVFTQTSS
jgi:hypothetical protein